MAAQTLAELAADDPQGSIRLMGELRSIAELQADELFAGGATASRRADDQAVRVLRDPGETLVPLWEHRYEDQHPYRANRAASQSRGGTFVVNQGGSAMSATPKHSAYVPGTSVQFVGDRIVFMDHFRLRLHDRLSGRMLGEGDGPEAPAPPKQNSPHDRIPAYDFASLRVAHDDERLFAVIGPKSRNLTGMNAVLRNRLAAYARDDVSPLWSTDRNETALKELTFLAAPTVFGSRLLVPVLQRGTYGLLCLDSATGGVLFHVRIHRAGSDMARPPASMVEVEAGIAYLLTNAGALASIDAHTGSLRWIRRYERAHPFREPVRAKPVARSQNPFGGRFFVEQDFYGFAPGELVVEDGLVIFAPCDGRVMHCIDGASGEPVWMASRLDPHSFLLGHNRDQLFVGGPDYVIGIDLRSGLRLWQDDLPSFSGSNRWRGRGLATDDLLLVPGKRQILVKHLAGDGGWSTLELPAFTYGRESLAGSFNLFLDGPYLAAAYEGGVELYSTTEALLALADRSDDLIERAVYQAQAGELLAAVGTLEAIDRDALDERRKLGVEQRMLSWASELALAMAVRGARDESLDLLARCRQHLHDTRYVQRWHLARIEVFQALGDLESVGDEQQALYALMGRKG
jgi:outer membrane protein assembly factor BamB